MTCNDLEPGEMFVSVGLLVLEQRMRDGEAGGCVEGPHCPQLHANSITYKAHDCDPGSFPCQRFYNWQKYMLLLWRNSVPMSIEVLQCPDCHHGTEKVSAAEAGAVPDSAHLLLEQWTVQSTNRCPRTTSEKQEVPILGLLQAVRSFLHFSQLRAWWKASGGRRPANVLFRLSVPGDNFCTQFASPAEDHVFPLACVTRSEALRVSVKSLPRRYRLAPEVSCAAPGCSGVVQGDDGRLPEKPLPREKDLRVRLARVSLRRDFLLGEGLIDPPPNLEKYPKRYQSPSRGGSPSREVPERLLFGTGGEGARDAPASSVPVEFAPPHFPDGRGRRSPDIDAGATTRDECSPTPADAPAAEDVRPECRRCLPSSGAGKSGAQEPLLSRSRSERCFVPGGAAHLRHSLAGGDAAFHRSTGLPLTSSPAPVRRGGACAGAFHFDNSLTSTEAIRSALFREPHHHDQDEDDDEEVRPSLHAPPQLSCSAPAAGLLGTFEESVLNGRLPPTSTVEGFSADIGASGEFCPRHMRLPVTVFFYSLLPDCDRTGGGGSSPYLAHVGLGPRGYRVPPRGTLQVTLFNPHRTVVKMFVVAYDLADMPPQSTTFLRQRTLYMPVSASEHHPDARQWLRYLIHLRFCSSRTGRVSLRADIRMIVFQKCDADVATLLDHAKPYELRSFVNFPDKPRYSPLK